MLVVMKAHATEEEVRAVCQKIESLGYRAHALPGAERTAIGITGNKGVVEAGSLDEMPGVQELIRVSKPYKLVSRDIKPDNTVIRFRGNGCHDRRQSVWPSWLGPARLKAMNRHLRLRSGYRRQAHSFSAEELTSHAPRRILSRGWAKKACALWRSPRPLWVEDHYRGHR